MFLLSSPGGSGGWVIAINIMSLAGGRAQTMGVMGGVATRRSHSSTSPSCSKSCRATGEMNRIVAEWFNALHSQIDVFFLKSIDGMKISIDSYLPRPSKIRPSTRFRIRKQEFEFCDLGSVTVA
jgi:hypothetical protein